MTAQEMINLQNLQKANAELQRALQQKEKKISGMHKRLTVLQCANKAMTNRVKRLEQKTQTLKTALTQEQEKLIEEQKKKF